MRMLWTVTFAGTMLLAAPSVGLSHAPMQSTNINRGVPLPVSSGEGAVQGQDAMVARQQEKLAETSADKKRAQIVDGTAKLLQLATELKAEMDKTNKNQMSLDVIRKADEIERLAHDLKQQMRDQAPTPSH
jgi:hypothetical protein